MSFRSWLPRNESKLLLLAMLPAWGCSSEENPGTTNPGQSAATTPGSSDGLPTTTAPGATMPAGPASSAAPSASIGTEMGGAGGTGETPVVNAGGNAGAQPSNGGMPNLGAGGAPLMNTGGAAGATPNTDGGMAGTGGAPLMNTGGTAGAAPNTDGGMAGTGGTSGQPPSSNGSLGCQAAEPLEPGERTIQAAGATRNYELILPPSYTPGGDPWPLVFALHPNEATDPIGYWHGENLPNSVNDRAVLVITASLPAGGIHNWNTAQNEEANLAYFDALHEELTANLCIDEARVFSMGFSGGGSFSSVLGCLRGDRFRGFASSGGILYFELTNPNAPCVGAPAAWVNIGTGEGRDDRSQMRDFWRQRNGCDLGEPVGPNRANNPPCDAYTCTEQPMTYCSHDGGHEWPGFGNEAVLEFFFGLD